MGSFSSKSVVRPNSGDDSATYASVIESKTASREHARIPEQHSPDGRRFKLPRLDHGLEARGLAVNIDVVLFTTSHSLRD